MYCMHVVGVHDDWAVSNGYEEPCFKPGASLNHQHQCAHHQCAHHNNNRGISCCACLATLLRNVCLYITTFRAARVCLVFPIRPGIHGLLSTDLPKCRKDSWYHRQWCSTRGETFRNVHQPEVGYIYPMVKYRSEFLFGTTCLLKKKRLYNGARVHSHACAMCTSMCFNHIWLGTVKHRRLWDVVHVLIVLSRDSGVEILCTDTVNGPFCKWRWISNVIGFLPVHVLCVKCVLWL